MPSVPCETRNSLFFRTMSCPSAFSFLLGFPSSRILNLIQLQEVFLVFLFTSFFKFRRRFFLHSRLVSVVIAQLLAYYRCDQFGWRNPYYLTLTETKSWKLSFPPQKHKQQKWRDPRSSSMLTRSARLLTRLIGFWGYYFTSLSLYSWYYGRKLQGLFFHHWHINFFTI